MFRQKKIKYFKLNLFFRLVRTFKDMKKIQPIMYKRSYKSFNS